jgi:hypothetical protein
VALLKSECAAGETPQVRPVAVAVGGIANPLSGSGSAPVPAKARFLHAGPRGFGRFPGIWLSSLGPAPIPWVFARAPNAAAAPVFKLGYLGPVLKQAVVAPNRA